MQHITPPVDRSSDPQSSRSSLAPAETSSSPREWNILNRYLPDPSLGYAKLPFGGGSLTRFGLPFVLFGFGSLCLLVPLWHLLVEHDLSLESILLPVGVMIVVVFFRPVCTAAMDLRTRRFFSHALRTIEIGLDRSVFQPETSFRYEVHLMACRQLDLQDLHVRLVFWENWRERRLVPWLKLSRWSTHRQGHDLATQKTGPLSLVRGEHIVVRGEINIPMLRPSEHRRGQHKHVSYVNVTVTLLALDKPMQSPFRLDCPRLITFPWM